MRLGERRSRRWLWGGVALLLGVAVAVGLFRLFGVRGTADLEEELKDRGRLVLLGHDDLAPLVGSGTELLREDEVPGLAHALEGGDPAAVTAALRAASVGGVLVDGRSPPDRNLAVTVRDRLRAYDYVEGLRGGYLSPTAGLYLSAESLELPEELSPLLGRLARELVGGSQPPAITDLPEPLRHIQSVEVMVLLKQNGRARLWRSARGSSIGRALFTAAVVARQRWEERESAMGGPLDDALPRMDIEVALLLDDGTVGVRTAAFFDRVFTPQHGVAYERRGAWRYLLPAATLSAGRGSALTAYESLLQENGLTPDALHRADLRLYRLVVRTLARSPGPAATRSPEPLIDSVLPLPDSLLREPADTDDGL